MRLSFFTTMSLAVLASATIGDDSRMYLAEYRFNDPKVRELDLTGTVLGELGFVPPEDWLLVGFQFDWLNRAFYWVHGGFNEGRIRRVDANGKVRTILSGLTNPRGLALDVGRGKLYWSDTQDRAIYRANTDGSGMEAIVATGSQYGRPALDLLRDKVYYGDFDRGEIRRSNLDGSNNELVISGVGHAIGIALHRRDFRIYWLDSHTTRNHVARARLNGAEFEVLVQFPLGSSGLVDIELDPPRGTMYWADEIGELERGVWSARFDGSNATRIYASPTGWNAGALTLVFDDCRKPFIYCDMNCDGLFNGGDIDAFFQALGEPAAWRAQHPGCSLCAGDANCDGRFDGADIDTFFASFGNHCGCL